MISWLQSLTIVRRATMIVRPFNNCTPDSQITCRSPVTLCHSWKYFIFMRCRWFIQKNTSFITSFLVSVCSELIGSFSGDIFRQTTSPNKVIEMHQEKTRNYYRSFWAMIVINRNLKRLSCIYNWAQVKVVGTACQSCGRQSTVGGCTVSNESVTKSMHA
jgi:hypothetical protein